MQKFSVVDILKLMLLKRMLNHKKFPEKDIIAENRSRNTKENAFNAAGDSQYKISSMVIFY